MATVVNGAGWYTTWLRAHYFRDGMKHSDCMNFMPVRSEFTKKARKGDPPCQDCVRRLYPGRLNGTGHK